VSGVPLNTVWARRFSFPNVRRGLTRMERRKIELLQEILAKKLA